jgi:hypothetical protein
MKSKLSFKNEENSECVETFAARNLHDTIPLIASSKKHLSHGAEEGI